MTTPEPASRAGRGPDRGRRWDAVSRAAMGPRLFGAPLNVSVALVVLTVGIIITVTIASGRSLAELAVIGAIGSILTGLAATASWWLAWEPSSRRAFAAFAWLGEQDFGRFRDLTGGAFPATFAGMTRYIHSTPERREDLWLRAEFEAATGDLDAAAATVDRMPAESAAERAQRLVFAAYIDWLAGGPGDPGPIRAATLEVGPVSSDERLVAEGGLAITEVRHKIAVGAADPAAPLRDFGDLLGRRTDWVVLIAARRVAPRYLQAAVLYVLAGIAVAEVFLR